jgi:hypothetical protein
MEVVECEFTNALIDFEVQLSSLIKQGRNLILACYGKKIALGGEKPLHSINFENFASQSPADVKLAFTLAYKQYREAIATSGLIEFDVVCGEGSFSLTPMLVDCAALANEEKILIEKGILPNPTTNSIYNDILLLHIYRMLSCVQDADDEYKKYLAFHIFTLEGRVGTKARTCRIKPKKAEPLIIDGKEITHEMIPLPMALRAVMSKMFDVELPDEMMNGVEGLQENPQLKALMSVVKPVLSYMTGGGNKSPQEMMAMVQGMMASMSGGMGSMFGGAMNNGQK